MRRVVDIATCSLLCSIAVCCAAVGRTEFRCPDGHFVADWHTRLLSWDSDRRFYAWGCRQLAALNVLAERCEFGAEVSSANGDMVLQCIDPSQYVTGVTMEADVTADRWKLLCCSSASIQIEQATCQLTPPINQYRGNLAAFQMAAGQLSTRWNSMFDEKNFDRRWFLETCNYTLISQSSSTVNPHLYTNHPTQLQKSVNESVDVSAALTAVQQPPPFLFDANRDNQVQSQFISNHASNVGSGPNQSAFNSQPINTEPLPGNAAIAGLNRLPNYQPPWPPALKDKHFNHNFLPDRQQEQLIDGFEDSINKQAFFNIYTTAPPYMAQPNSRLPQLQKLQNVQFQQQQFSALPDQRPPTVGFYPTAVVDSSSNGGKRPLLPPRPHANLDGLEQEVDAGGGGEQWQQAAKHEQSQSGNSAAAGAGSKMLGGFGGLSDLISQMQDGIQFAFSSDDGHFSFKDGLASTLEFLGLCGAAGGRAPQKGKLDKTAAQQHQTELH